MTLLRLIALALLLPVLGGCASPVLPYQADRMTAEQLREMAKDRSASAACSKVVGPWGTGTVVTVNLDKGAAPSGTTVDIGQDCIVRIGGQAGGAAK